jgi:hypothetical protein
LEREAFGWGGPTPRKREAVQFLCRGEQNAIQGKALACQGRGLFGWPVCGVTGAIFVAGKLLAGLIVVLSPEPEYVRKFGSR